MILLRTLNVLVFQSLHQVENDKLKTRLVYGRMLASAAGVKPEEV